MPIRGCVLVICNSFKNTEAQRVNASKADSKMMKELWGNMLRCDSFPVSDVDHNADFFVHHNLTAQAMFDLLERFAQWPSQTQYSYIAVVISTHGGMVAETWVEKWDPARSKASDPEKPAEVFEDYAEYRDQQKNEAVPDHKMVEVFFGNDFRPIREKKIKELFYNDTAVAWQDVPKIFVLSYCRGGIADFGVKRFRSQQVTGRDGVPFDDNRSSCDDSVSSCDEDRIRSAEEENKVVSIMPTISDVLVVYATHPSYTAFRGENGSWLVSTVGQIFKRDAKKMHVVDMLTIVNCEIKKIRGREYGRTVKAMSVYESSLGKNLYLCDEAKACGDLFGEYVRGMQLDVGRELPMHFHGGEEILVGEAPQRGHVGRNWNTHRRREATARDQRMQHPNEPWMGETVDELWTRIRSERHREEAYRVHEERLRDLTMAYGQLMNIDRRRSERDIRERNDHPRYREGPLVSEGRMQRYGEILLVFGLVAVSYMILPRLNRQ